MIGQENLRHRISDMIKNNTFPRFSIIVGPRGSGKKTIVHEMFDSWTMGFFVQYGIKVDDIRLLILDAYKVQSPTTYFIPDADNMSNAAKNAILKVTEEPPNNAYIIMTLEDESNTLDTIRSRGTIFYMDRYTPNEILEYAVSVVGMERLDSVTRRIITDLCETPGDVDLLNKMGIVQFYDYVELVVDNIAEVSLANAFKIPSKVALKEDVEGYDLKLFWKAFIKISMEHVDTYKDSGDILRYGAWALITSKYLQKLKVTGINKQMLIDNWVLEIYNG